MIGQAGAKPEIECYRIGLLCAVGRPHGVSRHAGGDGGDPAPPRLRWCSSTRARRPSVIFQALWRINEDNLAIALHHGSLAPEQRRKVEAAMARGKLRAIVCTSTLDLGIDWGAVDRVICIGAPKGAARLVQRIGRANHRLDEPSQAILVPANRFEVLECEAARDAVLAGELDGDPPRRGGLDVLAQHVLGMACSAPFDADALYREVKTASPYRALTRETFDRVLDFVATGGYALKRYDRYAKLRRTSDGKWRISHPRLAQQYRLNAGVIVEEPMLDVKLQGKGKPVGAGGRVLGHMEEYFLEQLAPGDTFVFSGNVLRFEGIRENAAYVTRTQDPEAEVPSYNGGKFPLSTFFARRVREMLADPKMWGALPDAGWRVAADSGMALGHPHAQPAVGRDLPARFERVSRLLPV